MIDVSTPIQFSKQQIADFGNLTGDNGYVHSVLGVVQGGLIISSLPKYLMQARAENNIECRPNTKTVTVIVNSKFRHTLMADQPDVKITFNINRTGLGTNRIFWMISDSDKEYCGGEWVINVSEISE